MPAVTTLIRMLVRGAFAVGVAIGAGAAPAQAQAQTQVPDSAAARRIRELAEQRLGRPVSAAEITAALRQSGLSRDAVRGRLHAAGLDSTLADPFFPTPTGGTPLVGRPLPDVIPALELIGLLPIERLDSLPAPDSLADTVARVPSRVFGKAVFQPANSIFDPLIAGPVDPGYRLGVGDQLQLVLTGQVEEAYTIEVRRDGTIFVPLLGQVTVAGLTLDGAAGAVRRAAARPISGVGSGAVRIDLTIARVRAIQVFVIGEVEAPGAYQVNALATAFHALARAGGPTEAGSFRRIEIRRAGLVLDTLDLYPYLVSGDASADRRLEQGDVLFVPLAERRVATAGRIRRPLRFELLPGESLGDLLRYAGGLEPDAATDRGQVDRVLPADERRPGMERRLLDLPLVGDGVPATPLYDGDSLTVLPVSALRRQVVTIVGEVLRPGSYEFRDGMTIGALVDAARGLQPWALGDRLKLRRLVPHEGRVQAFDLNTTTPAGLAFVLAEFDSVTVLDGRLAHPVTTVGIDGAIRIPIEMPWAEGLTLGDLVDEAGGFRDEAVAIEVSRRHISADYSDTNTVVFAFALDPGPRLPSAAVGFEVLRDDRAFVTAVPGFRGQEFFRVTGLFRFPGTYAILGQGERLSSAIRRAGGLLPGAYPASFRVTRGGRHLSATLEAVTRGDAAADLLLEPGDVLSIGPDPGTVFVTGEVERSALVAYERGRPLGYYLDRVGGVRPTGDRRRIVVEDPSGLARRTRRSLLLFRNDPEVRSGAIITVLAKPPREGGGIGQFITTSLQAVTTLASLIIAYKAVQ